MRQIYSRFPGKCKECSREHARGEVVWWEKGEKGVWCLACGLKAQGGGLSSSEPIIEEPVDRAELEAKTVAELKVVAKQLDLGSGVWRQGASKAQLINAILTGAVEEPTAPVVSGADFGSLLAAMITPAVSSAIEAKMPTESRIRAWIEERYAGRAQKIEITIPEIPSTGERIEHQQFPALVRLLTSNSRRPVFLVGPAGTGKTTAVEHAAEVLGLAFSCMSFGPDTRVHDLLGYRGAAGDYYGTEFRARYCEGGVFCGDELDNASDQVVTAMNSALSNGYCAFPDRTVKRHHDFRFVATGNTHGMGPNRVFCGRAQLDGASRDRFRFLDWPIDEKLEAYATENLAGTTPTTAAWIQKVRAIRKAADETGSRIMVTPRASIYGAELRSLGFTECQASDMEIFRGCSLDEKTKLLAAARVTLES